MKRNGLHDYRVYVSRDPHDTDTFHLSIDIKVAGDRWRTYHVAAIFEEWLDYMTEDHREDVYNEDCGPWSENQFMERVSGLNKGERLEVGLKLWIAEDD